MPYTPGATARWIDPTGTAWPLSDPDLGWFTLDEVTGLGAAPISLTTDADPRGGARVRWVQPEPRLITWGLHVFGPDHPTFLARWRDLARAFARTRRDGPGTLVVTRPDGSERQILAYYQEGFTNQPSAHFVDDEVVLTLFCEDPYWRDGELTIIPREETPPQSFLNPYPSVSTTSGLGQSTVFNPGSVEAWPDWTITGPASSITATNRTTGEAWTLDPSTPGIDHGPLLAGQAVHITTDRLSVRGPAGEVWTGALNWPDASLWGLAPGDNDVIFELVDAGFGSGVELSFYARHETP